MICYTSVTAITGDSKLLGGAWLCCQQQTECH